MRVISRSQKPVEARKRATLLQLAETQVQLEQDRASRRDRTPPATNTASSRVTVAARAGETETRAAQAGLPRAEALQSRSHEREQRRTRILRKIVQIDELPETRWVPDAQRRLWRRGLRLRADHSERAVEVGRVPEQPPGGVLTNDAASDVPGAEFFWLDIWRMVLNKIVAESFTFL